MRTVDGRRRRSRSFQRRWRRRRGAPGCGEDDGVLCVLDCIQTRGREAAGDDPWQSGASVDGVVVVLGLPKSKQVEERECTEEGERGK
jgi:hypothetical protein